MGLGKNKDAGDWSQVSARSRRGRRSVQDLCEDGGIYSEWNRESARFGQRSDRISASVIKGADWLLC